MFIEVMHTLIYYFLVVDEVKPKKQKSPSEDEDSNKL